MKKELKTAKELGLTQTQRRNIAKLTLFVNDAVSSPRFDIQTHHSSADHPSEATYECGTSACFCGYGPLAGIKPKKVESWSQYAARTMTVAGLSPVWLFLFSGEHKNSKTAAVRRGAWLLMNGLPENANFYTWETPKSFKPDWEAIKELANSKP